MTDTPKTPEELMHLVYGGAWMFPRGAILRHIASGGHYVVLDHALVEKTLEHVYTYRGILGATPVVFTRPRAEMEDGRFERTSPGAIMPWRSDAPRDTLEALLRTELAAALDALEDMVRQHVGHDRDAPLHSGFLSANADALRVLGRHGLVEITCDGFGRDVEARWPKKAEPTDG